jgi:tight adherence protein B
MRRLAAQPGAEGLREVASAWRVSERSGAVLSSALEQVAASARARHAAEHLVQAELSSARATARLVAVLPVVTLALAAGAGAEPWAFLLGHPAGLACLAAGAALVLAGLAWIDRIASGVQP